MVPKNGTSRRTALWAVAVLVIVGSALWLTSQIQFRVFQPRALQQRLFGEQIAPWSALRHASNGCCAMDASGILKWTYAIPAGRVVSLAKRCRFADGSPRPFTKPGQPYFDQHSKQCIIARYDDDAAAESASAEVSGNSLVIRLFYYDPDLIDQNFAVRAEK